MEIADVTRYSVEMKIPRISTLNEISSPEMLIHGVPWKVKVCKEQAAERQSLGVYLFCENNDPSPNWSISGSASFKLLSYSDKVEPVEYRSSTFIFDGTGIGYGKPDFIWWNDLFDKAKTYVKNDTIKLEVNVKAEDPNNPNRSRLNFHCINRCCANGSLATFFVAVKNVTNLMAVRSPTFTMRGQLWNIQISKEEDSHLGVLLQLNEDSENVSCKVAMAIKLLSKKKDQHLEIFDTKQYQSLKNLDVVTVVSWNELMERESGFVNNDVIMLVIELTSSKPKGGNANGANGAEDDLRNENNYKQMECAICLEYIDSQDLASTPCGHLFCFDCITKVVEDHAICPACSVPVQSNTLRRLYLPL